MRNALVVSVVAVSVAACSTPAASHEPASEPARQPAALYYAKDGAIYVSDPAGAPGRRLSDGPADTAPAPSPDGSRVAFVRKATPEDYGGELWVVDASGATGAAARMVDPADLGPLRGGESPKVGAPRWSPAGDRIAFLLATPTPAGSLVTAAVDTGEVLIPNQPMWADDDYAWSPDGSRIAWVQGRSDVSAVTVNVATADGESAPVAEGTAASSVAFGDDGATVIFTNPDTTDSGMFPPDRNPFTLRDGGVYTVPVTGGTTEPTPVLQGKRAYGDIAALSDGALGFTTTSPRGNSPTRDIDILTPGSRRPEMIARTPASGPSPVWSPDGVVAYLGDSADRPLLIMDGDERIARRVDTGVEAFAWR